MITEQQRRKMLRAVGVFLLTALAIVGLNSLSHGWHWDYSISRYVGLETWSAVLFALSNLVVAGLFGKYLYMVGELWQLPRWFYWMIVLTVVGLLGLSACPIGYFDAPGTTFASSVPSQVHQLCSRLMFVCMMLMALTWLLRSQVQTKIRGWCGVFLTYGVLCTVGFCFDMAWFDRLILVFESAYILGFMVLSWRLQSRIMDRKEE